MQTPLVRIGNPVYTIKPQRGYWRVVAWSRDREYLAIAGGHEVFVYAVNVGWPPKVAEVSEDVQALGFSPDGRFLTIVEGEGDIAIWDVQNERCVKSIEREADPADGQSFAWSHNGSFFMAASAYNVEAWETTNWTKCDEYEGHSDWVTSVAWSSDDKWIASGSRDNTVRLWDVSKGYSLSVLKGHTGEITSLAWSDDGRTLASAAADRTVRLWSTETGRQMAVLEGPTRDVWTLAFWSEHGLLAALTSDHLYVWRYETGDLLLDQNLDTEGYGWYFFLDERVPLCAELSPDYGVTLYLLHIEDLLASHPVASVKYTNAKVVLVGDSSVGKSGLALVLTGKAFEATESTHGRRVFTFESREVVKPGGVRETRETLLWDLAGQPGYRLIHQLHLEEVTVALVVFDAKSELDPFAGVRHWERALRQAHRLQGASSMPLHKFLVAGRVDRGTVGVSGARIDAVLRELGYEAYFDTSAKEGKNITELRDAIVKAIDWDALPKVSSTELFHEIREFIVSESHDNRLLSTVDDLYRAFIHAKGEGRHSKELRAQFQTCIALVEARGLVRRLSFGNFVLLQPEMLDAYASALVNAAREEPDGLGSIAEEEARTGRFSIPQGERLLDSESERLLILATIEDLLRHEIALRENSEDGPYLVFPAQLKREWPEAPAPDGQSMVFAFEGPVLSVYSTLIVRLAHSGIFSRRELWKDAALFSDEFGGACGVWLRHVADGKAEIATFFDPKVSPEMRVYFEGYIAAHLKRRALPETIVQKRTFRCNQCGTPFSDTQIQRRLDKGFDWIPCSVCESRNSLVVSQENLKGQHASGSSSVLAAMDRAADSGRDLNRAAVVLAGKQATQDFDVFLAHNSSDKPFVENVAGELRRRGLYPWIDKEQIPPGRWFQEVIQQAIPQVKTAAVFVGASGIGKWQAIELQAFIARCVDAGLPVIPILLPGVERLPDTLPFLSQLSYVKFRSWDDREALDKIVWGITGTQPAR